MWSIHYSSIFELCLSHEERQVQTHQFASFKPSERERERESEGGFRISPIFVTFIVQRKGHFRVGKKERIELWPHSLSAQAISLSTKHANKNKKNIDENRLILQERELLLKLDLPTYLPSTRGRRIRIRRVASRRRRRRSRSRWTVKLWNHKSLKARQLGRLRNDFIISIFFHSFVNAKLDGPKADPYWGDKIFALPITNDLA